MFINHTNHVSTKWSATQAEAARAWGAIEDLPFPDVGADWDEERVARLAEENAAKILAKEPRAVLCQGEFTYVHHLVNLLLTAGVTVLAATSRREVNEEQKTARCRRSAASSLRGFANIDRRLRFSHRRRAAVQGRRPTTASFL